MRGMYYGCAKCEWEGKRTGTMGAGIMRIRICPKCVGITRVSPIGLAKTPKKALN